VLNVTLRQLEVFVDAAETLSFARAAERRRLTPSAVSFQVRQVETMTGLALFERIGRRVALTPAGATLLPYARSVLGGMRDMEGAVAALSGTGGGRIRLGLVSTAKYIVPHLIARFRDIHPGVTVQLSEGNRARTFAQLISGATDLAIMGQPPEGDLLAVRFASHPTVLVAPARHKLLARGALAPADLAPEPFVIREPGSGTRALSDAFFRSAGFAPRIALETSSNEMIKQFVMAGMGLALISRHTINLELSLGLLATVPFPGLPVMRTWFVAQRRTAPLLPVQAALRVFLVEHGEGMIGELGRGVG